MLSFDNFDPSDCTSLIKAVKSQDTKNVQHALAQASQVGSIALASALRTGDRAGNTPLHHAVMRPCPALLLLLLHHADPDCVNKENFERSSPLLLLCGQTFDSSKKLEMLRALLRAGADPNAQTDPFSLPLCRALEQQWTEGVLLLLEWSADIQRRDFELDMDPAFLALYDETLWEPFCKRGGWRNTESKDCRVLQSFTDVVCTYPDHPFFNSRVFSSDERFRVFLNIAMENGFLDMRPPGGMVQLLSKLDIQIAPSLQHSCRRVVRRCVGARRNALNMFQKVHLLPVPSTLKEYLLYITEIMKAIPKDTSSETVNDSCVSCTPPHS